jgi:hypothetical protein
MVAVEGGILGRVADSAAIIAQLEAQREAA